MTSRRSFVEKLALGAGALMLNPIAETLVNEARGQVRERKRAFFYLVGNCLHHDWNFAPVELRKSAGGNPNPTLEGVTDFTWPTFLRNLERHRKKVLLIDNLANRPRTGSHGHSGGYAALSCFPAANGLSNEGGPPGGITIDQYLANRIGEGTRAKSVLFGVSLKESAQLASVFAADRMKPEPHFQSPALLFNDLFGALAVDESGVRRGAYKQRVLLDSMRFDIRRLQGALAGTERRKLDDYLAAVEDFDKRLKVTLGLDCKVPSTLAPDPRRKLTPEDKLEAMNEMAVLALACGMTNVVGMAAGCGMSHNYFPTYRRIQAGTPLEPEGGVSPKLHDTQSGQAPAMDLIHDFHAGLIGRMLDVLSTIKEGDRTAADNVAGVYLSENGEEHHSYKERWPVVVIGTAGGKIRTDGRFLRYPKKGSKGSRSMADLFCTIATACGAPTDAFGKGGNEPVQGPLPELAV